MSFHFRCPIMSIRNATFLQTQRNGMTLEDGSSKALAIGCQARR
jgi:hypothetical protein